MKKTMALLSLLLVATVAHAYDFTALAPGGQTLYFSFVPGGVMVTYPAATQTPVQGWTGFTKPVGVLTVPASVTSGGVTYAVVAVGGHAFYGCEGLTQVTVDEGVSVLRASAFRNCSALTTVSLPASLDSIYSYSFGYCAALTDVTVAGTTPPACMANVFGNTVLTGATLHVPCGCVAAWNTEQWSQFGSVSDAGCNLTISAVANYVSRGTVTGGGQYQSGTNVVLNAIAADGFFFACWNDGDTLNPRVVTAVENCTYTALFFALQHDTVTVTLHDTVTVTLHDTVNSVVVHVDTVTLFDTLVVTDTIYLTDSIMPTFFRITVAADGDGGVGIGNAILPAGTTAEIGALPLEGHRFLQWDDGTTDNPRRVTVTGNAVYTASFGTLGIPEFECLQTWTVETDGRDILVGGVQGRLLRVYAADGRMLFDSRVGSNVARFRCSATGVYLVSVDGGPARKVVVNNL